MEKEYKIYPDRLKEMLSLIVYALFIAGLAAILFVYRPNICISIVIAVFIVLLGVMISAILKKVVRNQMLYLVDEGGITDYTKSEHIIHLTWEEIAKIEVLSNYSSLQIGILGSKVLEDKGAISSNIHENLMRNGNTVFYNIMIDGFLFRKKQFQEIFQNLQLFAERSNSGILINEYVDPLAKKKK